MKKKLIILFFLVTSSMSFASEDFSQFGGASTLSPPAYNSGCDNDSSYNFPKLVEMAKRNAQVSAAALCEGKSIRISHWTIETGRHTGYMSYVPCHDFARVWASFRCE